MNRITLLAVVGGNEVTNPFMVTEVYVKEDGNWKLGSLSFTRLLTRGQWKKNKDELRNEANAAGILSYDFGMLFLPDEGHRY